MHVAMHRHPAVALQVSRGGVKLPRSLRQTGDEIRIHGHHGDRDEPHRRMIARCIQPLLGALLIGLVSSVQAQQRLAGQCPLLVPASQSELQPLRITPEQVASKNARGCLSPSDAIYGPDGCPVRMCGNSSGVIQLPGP
jgi:hypothetical protein